MLSGHDIVCLSSQDWDSHLNVPQQTMMRLARANRVVYAGVPRTWAALARVGDAGRRTPRLVEVQPNLHVWTPPPVLVPANHLPPVVSRVLEPVNGRTLAALVRGVLRELRMGPPLLWIYGVPAAPAAGRVAATATIYDCIDEWAGYLDDGPLRENVVRLDRRLLNLSDVVFIGSERLLEGKRAINPNTHFVPHAADFANFRRAGLRETAVAPALAALPRPVVGLAGVIEKRLDTAIVEHLARSRPAWTVAIVGPVWDNVDVSVLRTLPNVHFLGKQPVGELPCFIKGFDVCMIPYVIDDFTRNIYPLKLHEYLASGKPVVATRIPAVAAFESQGLTRIADTPAAFLSAVEDALAEADPVLARRRIDVAAANTWEARVERKSELVADVLARKARQPQAPARAEARP
jgi:glycosyltransferase involved in cell wall biosynthesis